MFLISICTIVILLRIDLVTLLPVHDLFIYFSSSIHALHSSSALHAITISPCRHGPFFSSLEPSSLFIYRAGTRISLCDTLLLLDPCLHVIFFSKLLASILCFVSGKGFRFIYNISISFLPHLQCTLFRGCDI